jgi:plasmid stabilization system protein ParE
VLWTRRAIDDLGEVLRFIGRDNARVARQVAARVLEAAQVLAEHPGVGRPGRVAHTREFVVSRTPYILPYRVVGDAVEILRVLHSARRWPRR